MKFAYNYGLFMKKRLLNIANIIINDRTFAARVWCQGNLLDMRTKTKPELQRHACEVSRETGPRTVRKTQCLGAVVESRNGSWR